MKCEVKVITPDVAAKMLENNHANRNIREGKVAEYAADMKAGKWFMNGETICISEDGTVLDGQHRLLAVVKSGCSITVPVCVVDEGQGKVYDIGAARRTTDIMQISGDPELADFARASVYSSTSRKLLVYSGLGKPSSMEVIENIKNNLDCFEWMRGSGLAKYSAQGVRVVNTTAIAAILAAYQNGESAEHLERFVNVLGEGLVEDRNERVIILLRDWLLKIKTRSDAQVGTRSKTNNLIYATVQAALKKYIDGKGDVKIVQASHKSLYIWHHNFRRENENGRK